MADVRTVLDEVETPAPAAQSGTILREDYRPPDWLVPEISLDFDLAPERTIVRAILAVERNGGHRRPLRLDSGELELISLRLDGREIEPRFDNGQLVVEIGGEQATVETEVAIAPSANSKLMGLYESGGMLCTQCEAEGFRRITFFPDRPDVLSRYTVRMEADKATFPILLSNGNRTAEGDLDAGRHWALWSDPFTKPCYLFALVAGNLKANRDRFTTMSGREVELAIWVREEDLPRTQHAMDSLKASMAWDERVYGREYDLDLFNIVAVSDFNMGAMENKSLNIFNTAYVLADPETATDVDFDNIARVVAHEYFHNWSGNRVTCRDWFQLSLKEGFTVFRDQGFGADMGSPAVKRIEDVRVLRAAQFPEDSGPLAHPVRPDSYLEISNFYTATIYNKGAELIRMFALMLGPEKFRAGTDLYFERHDGEAATCDDFVKALEDASGVDLSAFKIWYSQAGTPKVEARVEHDPERATATLHLSQRVEPTPGQPDKRPMPIPLRTGLVGSDSGKDLTKERLVLLDEPSATVTFENIRERPLLSINRGFSAPVRVEVERGAGELEALAATDSDPFARYEALQELMTRAIVAGSEGRAPPLDGVVEAVRGTLSSGALDAAFKAEAVLPPSENLIFDRVGVIDPDKVHSAREALRSALGSALGDQLQSIHGRRTTSGSDLSPAAKGERRLRSVALGLLAASDPVRAAGMARTQYDGADNMTERMGALGVLVSLDAPEREAALGDYYERFRDNALVIDKWFSLQASAQRETTIDDVLELARHPNFSIANPNRLRALAGMFGGNSWAFNWPDGRGYALLTETILAADKLNPQAAARLVPAFGRWRRMEPKRSAMMRAALERIAGAPGVSKDVYEQASKSLA